MNNIDVEKLSHEEFYDLYKKVCRRINALQRSRMAEKLQEFKKQKGLHLAEVFQSENIGDCP